MVKKGLNDQFIVQRYAKYPSRKRAIHRKSLTLIPLAKFDRSAPKEVWDLEGGSEPSLCARHRECRSSGWGTSKASGTLRLSEFDGRDTPG